MTDIIAPPAPVAVPIYPPLGSQTFNQDAYNYGSSMPGVAAGMQALAANVHNNTVATSELAAQAAGSASAAGTMAAFKGLWSALSGALARPATVLENGAYWMLLQDLPDVAAVRPGTNAAVWTPQILEARNLGAVNLDTVVNAGSYAVSGALTNAPPGVTSALVNVTRYGALAVQDLSDTATGSAWRRMGSALTTAPAWTAWGRVSQDNTPAVALGGGAMDCSRGTYFTESVSAARTLSFANIPTGAYACVLEVYHTGGAITLPAGTVWVAGAPPILQTPRRHLFFFQKAVTGSGGWIVSCLPNSAI